VQIEYTPVLYARICTTLMHELAQLLGVDQPASCPPAYVQSLKPTHVFTGSDAMAQYLNVSYTFNSVVQFAGVHGYAYGNAGGSRRHSARDRSRFTRATTTQQHDEYGKICKRCMMNQSCSYFDFEYNSQVMTNLI
jgi:hypothetical protein